jgi:hypothetical protein
MNRKITGIRVRRSCRKNRRGRREVIKRIRIRIRKSSVRSERCWKWLHRVFV